MSVVDISALSSFELSSPFKSSSDVIPRIALNSLMMDMSGIVWPLSHLDTALNPTPTISPSSRWVKPFCFLILAINLPIFS